MINQRPILAALLLALLLPVPRSELQAQSVHAYRDASGQWVFTDRGANVNDTHGNAVALTHSPEALHVAVERSDSGTATRFTAVNDCLCVVNDVVYGYRKRGIMAQHHHAKSITDKQHGYPDGVEDSGAGIIISCEHSNALTT